MKNIKNDVTDIDIVKFVSKDLLDIYIKAKEYVEEIPDYSLVKSRDCGELLLKIIYDRNNYNQCGKTFYDNIFKISEEKFINKYQVKLFNKLRIAGNKGAHSYKFNLSESEKIEIAKDAIYDVIKLCNEFSSKKINLIDGIVFTENINIKSKFYDSIFKYDSESSYLSGLACESKAKKIFDEDIASAKKNNEFLVNLSKSNKLYRAAGFYFKNASDDHGKAAYEYAKLIINRKIKFDEHEDNLFHILNRASDLGSIDAKVELGTLLLSGENGIKINYDYAVELLKEASECDNPIAHTNLGYMYKEGLGCIVDYVKAFNLFEKASLAEIPEAQYNLSECYLYGYGVEKNSERYLHYLNLSACQNLPDAILSLARLYLKNDIIEKNTFESERLYNKYLLFVDSPEILKEIACLYAEGAFGEVSYVNSLMYLNKAYSKIDNNCDLKYKIEIFSKKIVKKYYESLAIKNYEKPLKEDDIQNAINVLIFFDENDNIINNKSLFDDDNFQYKPFKIMNRIHGEIEKIYRQKNKKLHCIKQGRNEKCSCGSNLKYKKCCGN